MPVALVRKPRSFDVSDADEARAALKADIVLELKLKGLAMTRLVFLAEGHEESLDLTSTIADDAEAHMGATFQMLSRRPKVARAFMVLRLETKDHEDKPHVFALLFEEITEPGAPRRWWLSMQEFRTDPNTNLGHPIGDWQDAPFETSDKNHLPPFLREFVDPPPGSRPAHVLQPRQTQPDIQVAMDNLPPNVPAPTDARMMAELAASLAVPDLLSGVVKGTAVVRYAQRVWEMWVLGDDMPADLEDMVRTIANKQATQAEGVAIVVVAILPEDTAPQPFVQVIAELGGSVVEARAPLDFPEGPAGPKQLREVRWREGQPVPEGGLWLGVDPMVQFELGPIGVGEG